MKVQILQEGNNQKYIEQLESTMNRVSIQQDALMPLLQMIEYLPSIQKTEQTIKSVLKKEETNEIKSQRLERCAERKIKEWELQQIKAPSLTVDDVSKRMNDLEQSLNCLYRWYETKLKEGSQQISRNLEEKLNLDPNSEFHDQLLRVVEDTMSNAIRQMQDDFTSQIQDIKLSL